MDLPGGSRAMVAVLGGCLAVFAMPAALGGWWVRLFGMVCLAPIAALARFRDTSTVTLCGSPRSG